VVTQNYDVMLNGAGYMLVPPPETGRTSGAGSNYRLDVVPFKPTGVRTGIRDWLLPLSPHDETRWRADGMVPELSGYGVAHGLVIGPALRGAFTTGAFTLACLYNGALYLVAGANLYRLTLTAGAVTGVTLIGAAAGAITGMWVWNARLYLALAAAATSYASTDGVTMVTAPGTAVGLMGFGYGRANWLIQRAAPNGLQASYDGGATWLYWTVEGIIRAVLQTGKSVLIFHTAGIEEINGSFVDSVVAGSTTTTWNGSILPLVRTVGAGAASDYVWAVDYGGYVYTWFAGTVCRVERSTITGGRVVPLPGAPRGLVLAAGGVNTAVVAAGRLWVIVVVPGFYELWSFDGARWVRHQSSATVQALLVASVAGIASDADVLLLLNGGGNVYALLTQATGHTVYPTAVGNVVCGPWDAGKPDNVKTWTECEIVWQVPDRAVTPSGAVLIETSVNGGVSWAVAGTTALTLGTGGTIRQALAGVSGETLSVRVTWTPTANATGFRLASVYANGWELPAAPVVKRWGLRLRCSDKLLNRLGNVDARTGEAMRAALIGLASSGAPVVYQDLDYDANVVNQTVRVVAVEEAVRRGDGTHFWESEMAVTLEAIG